MFKTLHDILNAIIDSEVTRIDGEFLHSGKMYSYKAYWIPEPQNIVRVDITEKGQEANGK